VREDIIVKSFKKSGIVTLSMAMKTILYMKRTTTKRKKKKKVQMTIFRDFEG
jgi:hypothetical protein